LSCSASAAPTPDVTSYHVPKTLPMVLLKVVAGDQGEPRWCGRRNGPVFVGGCNAVCLADKTMYNYRSSKFEQIKACAHIGGQKKELPIQMLGCIP
jgi:hypothetical protein